MNATERQAKIEAYGQAGEKLEAALKALPRAAWHFRPTPDEWTIHEVVVHITDSEANSYVRARRLAAEPGSTVLGYDEMQWARALNYTEQNADEALELFQLLRRNTYQLIRHLPPSVWDNTVTHSESGLMTFDEWLDIYERHVREHIEQMHGIYAAWQRTNNQ
ncbi:MAG: DinB family protein [Anaerolineales bacterium]|nr:DinB family protein [Anaerolineales bacterium]